MLPDVRTHQYAEWRVCERFNIRPPRVKPCWDDNDVETKMLLIAYNQIRQIEEAQSGRF